MTDRKQAEKAIREAVTEAMSNLTDEELRELVTEPYAALRSLLSETQEDEWEYRAISDVPSVLPQKGSEKSVRALVASRSLPYTDVERRRKAGPWEPVPVAEDNRVDRRPHDKYDTEIPEG